MDTAEERSAQQQEGLVYEVREVTDRWAEPTSGTVISRHSSAQEALDALHDEPQYSSDGTGRSAQGNYVSKVCVRIDAEGNESMLLEPPRSDGLLTWPTAGT